jgi:hypothetical protein
MWNNLEWVRTANGVLAIGLPSEPNAHLHV